jgi:hypothetical protein
MEFVFKDLTNNTSYNALDTIITFIFIGDIIVGFNTRYIDGTGETITDRKKISRRYLKGDFIIDFISSIPFKILGLLVDFFNQISFLKILKVVRIRRITKLVLKLEFREEQKAVIYIFKLALELILILHILGCFWFLVIDNTKIWAPPIDFIYVQRNEYLRFYDLEEVDS